MKNYFPHDSDARSDEKIIALRIRHKWEGYGLYWALIEKLRDSKDYTLKTDYNGLAFDLRSDAAILKSVINDFGLFAFTDNGECFYSESLSARMKPLDDKKAKLSNAGKRGNEKRWGTGRNPADNQEDEYQGKTSNQSQPDAKQTATQSPPDRHPIPKTSQIRRDKKRVDKNILEESIKESTPNGVPKKGELSLTTTDKIDFVNLMEYFNSTFSGKLQAIKSIDDKRKKAIKARAAQYGKQAIFDVFQIVLKSEFLLGNNDRNWRCDFDWIFKASKFTNILEGNYNGKRTDTAATKRESVRSLKDLAGAILQGAEPEKS